MKKFTATIVSTLTHDVSVEVADDISQEDLEAALCEAATLPDGDFDSEACDIKLVERERG
jgi:hypothetical protein